MILREIARDWLLRYEKHPVKDGACWRWTLGDPPDHDGMSDLPGHIFDHLPAVRTPGGLEFTRHFTTRDRANEAAVEAILASWRAEWDATPAAPESAEYPEVDEA